VSDLVPGLGLSPQQVRESGLLYLVTATFPGALTARRGGAGPVRGLRGGKPLTGRLSMPRHGFFAATASLLPCKDHASAIAEVAEDVVVAGGGMVGEDGRHQVRARDPSRREEEATALAQARAAAVPRGTAGGLVVGDRAAVQREARRALWGGPAVSFRICERGNKNALSGRSSGGAW
jgi:hypothetical protein